MGQTEITGRSDCLMRKNGEHNVVDFVCGKGRRVDIYAGSHWHSCNLTNMCWKASACIGLCVAMVPESSQRIMNGNRTELVNLGQYYMRYNAGIICMMMG
jgi:hypothetical protein